MICECGWKHDEKQCPMCGKKSPQKTKKVRQWNSTLKANPSKKPKKKSGTELKDAMVRKALEYMKGRTKIECQNCGLELPYLRYSNISHDAKRSLAPSKRLELENMTVLCSAQNFWGKVDQSCHTIWERNDHDKYYRFKGMRKGMKGT